jgi:uncharacterized protein YkwD
MYSSVTLLLATFTCCQAQGLEARTIDKINSYRHTAGLGTVTLDPDLSKGCEAHAQYLAQNAQGAALNSLSWYEEDPKLPGYSEEGAKAGRVAQVRILGDPPFLVIDQWMATLYHRTFLLDPDLKRAGLGYARDRRGRWVSVLDLTRGKGDEAVQIYPVEDQKDVPLAYPGREVPDPTPQTKNIDQPGGYPITVTFPAGVPVKEVTASVRYGVRRELDLWVSTPEKPAFTPGHQRNTVCVIAREPFQPATVYNVLVTARVGGQPWKRSWNFTTQDDDPPTADVARLAIKKINAYRKDAGLGPVALDLELSRACTAHARYLALNGHQPAVKAGRHEEDRKLPGYTEEGSKVARHGLIGRDDRDPVAAIDRWMALFLHRLMVLDPQLSRIGFGGARRPGNKWICVMARLIEPVRGRAPVVIYPGEKQKEVPLAYEMIGETPDSLLQSKDKRGGYPVTVTFWDGDPLKNVAATLTDGAGKEVETWLSTPEEPIAEGHQHHTICLIAKDHLQPETTYTVAITADAAGKPWKQTWSFTTGAGKEWQPDPDAIVAQVNAYRKLVGVAPVTLDPALSKGCQAHAEYLVRNHGHPQVQGLNVHKEDPSLPGYSEEGARAAQASVIQAGANPAVAVDGWMATFFHRLPILDPDLKRIGWGQTVAKGPGWITVMDTSRGKGRDRAVFYPAAKQENVPLAYHRAGYTSDPIPKEIRRPVGYPITVTFPESKIVKKATATLVDRAGREVFAWVTTPEAAEDKHFQRNTIGLIAKDALAPNTSYTVTVEAEVSGEAWKRTWSFTTGKR